MYLKSRVLFISKQINSRPLLPKKLIPHMVFQNDIRKKMGKICSSLYKTYFKALATTHPEHPTASLCSGHIGLLLVPSLGFLSGRFSTSNFFEGLAHSQHSSLRYLNVPRPLLKENCLPPLWNSVCLSYCHIRTMLKFTFSYSPFSSSHSILNTDTTY